MLVAIALCRVFADDECRVFVRGADDAATEDIARKNRGPDRPEAGRRVPAARVRRSRRRGPGATRAARSGAGRAPGASRLWRLWPCGSITAVRRTDPVQREWFHRRRAP